MGVRVPSPAQILRQKNMKGSPMKTEVETVSPIIKKIRVEVPVERVKQAFEAAFQKVQKKAKMKGFRQGKVPQKLMEQHYAQEIHQEALEKLIDLSYPEAVEKEAVLPISQPKVDIGSFGADKNFEYSATFEVRPDVTLQKYVGIDLSHPSISVSQEEVNAHIVQLQERFTQLEPVSDTEAAISNGMVVVIDFEGRVGGESVEGNKATDYEVEIGAQRLLPDFEKCLIGLKMGQQKEVSFSYPEDYFKEEFRSKEAVYSITVKGLKRKNIPELNDDFAKDCGNYQSLAELKSSIEKDITAHKEQMVKQYLSEQAVEKLVEGHLFDVPDSMVHQELASMYDYSKRRMKEQSGDKTINPEKFIEKYKDVAANRVRGYLILDAIAQGEGLEVRDTDLEAGLTRMATQMGRPLDEVKKYYGGNNQAIHHLKYTLLHEKVLDFVIGKAKIEVKVVKNEEKK